MLDLVIIDRKGNYFCDCNDPLNVEKTRNCNTELFINFNCFGYAFETYNWVTPFPTYDFLDYVREETDIIAFSTPEEYEDDVIYDTFSNITDDFYENIYDTWDDELSCFKEEEQLDNIRNEIFNYHNYMSPLAHKIAIDHIIGLFKDVRRIKSLEEVKDGEYGIAMAFNTKDFHFAKIEDDIITHKMGGLKIEAVDSLDEAFSKYPSKRYYFAKRISE